MEILEQAKHALTDKKYRHAYKLYQLVTQEEGNKALAFQGQAECLCILRKYKEAHKCASNALSINPKLSRVHYILAYIYARKKDWGKSMLEIQEALEIEPEMVEARELFSSLLLVENKKSEAFEINSQLVRDGKASWLTHFHLGDIYRSSRNYKDAIFEYQHSLRKKLSLTTLLRIIETYSLKNGFLIMSASLILLLVSIRLLHLFWTPFLFRTFA
jgi:tetratricopeptide (TPR) repeat protein